MGSIADLILPGPQPPKGGLSIWVPRGYEERPPTATCNMCGGAFAGEAELLRHFRTCILNAGHDHRAEEYEKRERLAIFQEENWDPEVSAHLRKVGERMLAEGRWEVKPNERAGFA